MPEGEEVEPAAVEEAAVPLKPKRSLEERVADIERVVFGEVKA